MTKRTLVLFAFVVLPVLTAASVPGFNDLETRYAREGGMAGSRASLAEAIPIGTPVTQASQKLIAAGARCHTRRDRPEVEQCLIHQYSLADGAADDIRWTIRLHVAGRAVESLAVDRTVDRHGSN